MVARVEVQMLPVIVVVIVLELVLTSSEEVVVTVAVVGIAVALVSVDVVVLLAVETVISKLKYLTPEEVSEEFETCRTFSCCCACVWMSECVRVCVCARVRDIKGVVARLTSLYKPPSTVCIPWGKTHTHRHAL